MIFMFRDGDMPQYEEMDINLAINTFLTGISTMVYNENGMPFSSGYETKNPGCIFADIMLREIRIEAQRISASIAGKSTLKR